MERTGVFRYIAMFLAGLVSLVILYFVLSVLIAQFQGQEFPGQDGRVRVHMSFWGGELEDTFRKVAADYSALHPNRFVDLESQSGREYGMWMRVQLLGNRPPNIMQAQWGELDQYIRAGKLHQMDSILEQVNPYTKAVWREMFFQGRLDSVRDYHNNLYIIPINQVKTGIFYNKDIFRRARIDPPETFEDLMALSERLREGGYIPMGVGNVQPAEPVVWTPSVFFDSVYRDSIPLLDTIRVDGRVDTEEVMRGYKLGIIDPLDEKYKAIWEVMKRWSTTWNRDFNGVHGDIVRRDFLDQKNAMIFTGVWMVKHLKDDIAGLPRDKRFEFGVFPMPNITKETSPHFSTPLGSLGSVGMGFVIPKATMGQELTAAIDWLRYITQPEVVDFLQGDATMLPCIHGVPIREEMQGFLPLMDGTFPDLRIQEGRLFPDSEAMDDWFGLFQSYLADRISLDEMSERWKKACLAGVERVILIEAYATSQW